MIKKVIGKIKKKILFPEFLDKINYSWLLDRPRLWLLKLHYVAYYALLVNVIIFFIVLISPIKVYHLSNFLVGGIVIIAIGEVIALIYWLYKQSLYNIEKQYGNTCKSRGFLELLGYSICIILIASATFVFYLSVAIKSANFIIPQTDLSIDLLILDSINGYDRTYISSEESVKRRIREKEKIIKGELLKNENDENKFYKYLQSLREYMNNDKLIQKQKSESIFSDKYDTREERKKLILKVEESNSPKNWQLFFLKNEELRDLLKQSISIENLIFIEYDPTPSDYMEKIFNYLVNKKINNIKNSSVGNGNLVKSIKQGNTKEIIRLLENYTGVNISNNQSQNILDEAQNSAYGIYSNFYDNELALQSFLLIHYLVVQLIVILLFLFKNTYLLDFIFALIYLFVFVVLFTFTASLSWLNNLSVEIKVVYFVFAPTLFCYFQTLNFIKPNKYSRFKTLHIIIFPFALILSAIFALSILYGRKILVSEENNSILAFMQIAIVCLIYLPFIPYIKGQLTRQLSLPKD